MDNEQLLASDLQRLSINNTTKNNKQSQNQGITASTFNSESVNPKN